MTKLWRTHAELNFFSMVTENMSVILVLHYTRNPSCTKSEIKLTEHLMKVHLTFTVTYFIKPAGDRLIDMNNSK